MKNKIALIAVSPKSFEIALLLKKDLDGQIDIYGSHKTEACIAINSVAECTAQVFDKYDILVYIGAMGICVRSIAPYVKDKYSDPAVINIDSTGKYVISVLSGHVGGANQLAAIMASIIGAEPVITTQSDNTGLWALDTIATKFGWKLTTGHTDLNQCIFGFVNQEPTALLIDIHDKGTDYLERTAPSHVHIYRKITDIDLSNYKVLIIVSPFLYHNINIPVVTYRPQVLHLGVGCRRNCAVDGVADVIRQTIEHDDIAVESIASISTVDLKKDELLVADLRSNLGNLPVHIYESDELKDIVVPNPSKKVEEVTGSMSVSESSAILSAHGGTLLIEKQKGKISEGNDFTFALAIDKSAIWSGHIEIVGAGPGDPDLVSVRGRHFLEKADLILYAGSLVPKELTYCAKAGATVRSSAHMTLEEQFELMKQFYDKGLLVVRLHTGDPCIYGAIQEQMAFFDEHAMNYHITPGISSFQAAAAALNSQFTIPEKVQTIILTRGEGRTPMPEKEKLHLLAKSQSTMCIYLSATVVEDVQQQLLEHYAPETPVAACYKLTWKDEHIYRGELKDLAQIVRDNKLTLTTLLVVGDAIDNRKGLSRLYSHEFTHLFREKQDN